MKDGIVTKRYRTGVTKLETTYVNDLKHGIEKAYDKDGKLTKETGSKVEAIKTSTGDQKVTYSKQINYQNDKEKAGIFYNTLVLMKRIVNKFFSTFLKNP